MNHPEPASPSAVPTWTLADRLRKARIYAGYDQTELEARTGISRQSISNYENGRTVPSRPVLLSWAIACGVDLEWLAGTGPTPRRRKRPPPGRRIAALMPLAVLAAGYLGTLPGLS